MATSRGVGFGERVTVCAAVLVGAPRSALAGTAVSPSAAVAATAVATAPTRRVRVTVMSAPLPVCLYDVHAHLFVDSSELSQESNGTGMSDRVSTPYDDARRAIRWAARSASAAMVSDGLTHSDVGTLAPSVTKMPGCPRSSCRSSQADKAGSSPIRHDDNGCAVSALGEPVHSRNRPTPSCSTM